MATMVESKMSLAPVNMLCPSLNIPTPSTASSDSPTYGKRRGRYYLYRDSENREPCLAPGSQPASVTSCADFLQHCIPITTTRRSADCDKYKTTVLLGDITPKINPKVTSSPRLSARCQAQSAILSTMQPSTGQEGLCVCSEILLARCCTQLPLDELLESSCSEPFQHERHLRSPQVRIPRHNQFFCYVLNNNE